MTHGNAVRIIKQRKGLGRTRTYGTKSPIRRESLALSEYATGLSSKRTAVSHLPTEDTRLSIRLSPMPEDVERVSAPNVLRTRDSLKSARKDVGGTRPGDSGVNQFECQEAE